MTLAVEASGLSKAYGANLALARLDMRVEAGEVFGLIGPNGAGKTTTMRLLLDVIRPTAGSVKVFGTDPRVGGPALRKRVAFLPGELRLSGQATGRGILNFYARLEGDVRPARFEELAERLGLDLTARVGTLSKGNKQKLGLVQAFMRPADLLILDEPTSGLDPVMQREFLQLVREAQAAGRTVLLSSHVLSEVQQVAGRVGILGRGRLLKVESVAALRAAAPRRVRLSARLEDLPRVHSALAELDGVYQARRLAPGAGTEGDVVARYQGPPAPLLALLGELPLTDLVIAEPDLEEAVMDLYATGRVAAGTGSEGTVGA